MIFWLILASVVGWFISTIAGGGSSLILMPIIGLCLGAAAIPVVTTVGAIFGNADRAIAYRENIHWEVIAWELSGAIPGAILGAFTLTQINTEWLSLIIGLFLLFSAINYFFKNSKKSDKKMFGVLAWYFLPLGFIYAFLSGLIGSTVPILVPFYLNYGLQKEELLGTQAVARVVIHALKIIAYALFGILTWPYIIYGIAIGLASFPGNWLGHLVLGKMSEQRFQQLAISFVLVSGVLMLWQQRQLFLF